ncbi:LysE family translocator [Thalassotalea profundi]|uniref:Lysine transporter LysE n=1 Tax=Thalassotalea profundi TaxID=2036687 RepID=A0ABQ3IDU2_9GAMM|nr:LysE family transporter [Thalassotalea profundi]GHE77172.1 lysine transporter LysE [Thalassotalea profundi]
MNLFEGLLLITSIHLLAAASPGPDFVLVTQQTLTQGKKAGLLCSIGIALGLSIHIIYSALGLAAVIASSETALWLIKSLGGCYLLYLGIKGIKAKATLSIKTLTNDNNTVTAHQKSTIQIIGLGFLCNALNPKAPIYFVALFTIVLSPDMPIMHICIYGLWMMMIQLLWFSCVTLLFSRPRVNYAFQKLGHWLDRILGSAMIIMGIKVITTKIN